jgi:hypothetical protein
MMSLEVAQKPKSLDRPYEPDMAELLRQIKLREKEIARVKETIANLQMQLASLRRDQQ